MQRQAAQHGVRFGKNRYFFDDGEKRQLGPRLLALMGFYSSVRPVYKQLMVNVNVCMAAFYEPGKLSDALHAFDSRSRGAIPQDLLAKVKVSTSYRGYKCVRTIFRISNVSAKKQKFLCQEYGRKVSVEEYFSKCTLSFSVTYVPCATDSALKYTVSSWRKRTRYLSLTLATQKNQSMSQRSFALSSEASPILVGSAATKLPLCYDMPVEGRL